MNGKVGFRMAAVAVGAGAGAWLGATAPTGVMAGAAIGACLALAFGWKSTGSGEAPAGPGVRRGSVPKILVGVAMVAFTYFVPSPWCWVVGVVLMVAGAKV